MARTFLDNGNVLVSTVFLGINHNWTREGDPLLFETMCFQGEDMADGFDLERYSTWEEAETGHHRIVERITARLMTAERETAHAIANGKSKC